MADERYKYAYPLVLTPLRSDIDIDFNSKEAITAIKAAVSEYNKSASVSRTCPKELIDLDIHKRQICITLAATDVIKSPGRALRTFSLKLLNYSYFQQLVTDEHKLFTTLYEEFDDEREEDDELSISDKVLLKCVTDAIFSPNNPVMISALNEIRQVCEKYHLNEKYS